MSHVHDVFCTILPPHILKHMATVGDKEICDNAYRSMEAAAAARGQRATIGPMAALLSVSPGEKRRTVFDAKNAQQLPGKLVRGESDKAGKDVTVNEAFDGAGATYDFYRTVYGRNSVDGNGMRLDSTVHYGRNFDNAFWNGMQMVYGDGDGRIFNRFTLCIDVIGHELTHGVVQFSGGLVYQDQSGALNEHFADVFGSLVKQYQKKQTADKADWLIGEGLLAKGIKGIALRSLKSPGTAYNDPMLGRDPQPSHMRNLLRTDDDNGGVHINSGIPNKAFQTLAATLGGFAWEKAGRIWYQTLTRGLTPNATFQQCAEATFEAAGTLFGAGKAEQLAVRQAWQAVGLDVVKGQVVVAGPKLTVKDAASAPAPSAPAAAAVAAKPKARAKRSTR
ncbi:MAG TPA: M4 family metallopeptidase [Thermoanaerobaculia bacterium]|jgi:Zn-dependent metalloprotease|nr:M4 family metallopeptidase [Thermoanaerobaculia bacterium]